MNKKYIKLFLRFGLGIAFLSAVADRFGMLPADISAWGNWESFLDYTAVLNPWFPASFIPALGILATASEVFFGIFLLIGFKTEFFGKLSGVLLLIFALSMAFTIGPKKVLDFSVLAASGAGFALGTMKEKYLEVDLLFQKKKGKKKK